eukprot:PhM_4_TR2951/c0_g1_i1/m.50485
MSSSAALQEFIDDVSTYLRRVVPTPEDIRHTHDWAKVLTVGDLLPAHRTPLRDAGVTAADYQRALQALVASEEHDVTVSQLPPYLRLRRVMCLAVLLLHGLCYDVWLNVDAARSMYTADTVSLPKPEVVAALGPKDTVDDSFIEALNELLAPAQLVLSLQYTVITMAQALYAALKPMYPYLPRTLRRVYNRLNVRPVQWPKCPSAGPRSGPTQSSPFAPFGGGSPRKPSKRERSPPVAGAKKVVQRTPPLASSKAAPPPPMMLPARSNYLDQLRRAGISTWTQQSMRPAAPAPPKTPPRRPHNHLGAKTPPRRPATPPRQHQNVLAFDTPPQQKHSRAHAGVALHYSQSGTLDDEVSEAVPFVPESPQR